jgi:hypothetical protein
MAVKTYIFACPTGPDATELAQYVPGAAPVVGTAPASALPITIDDSQLEDLIPIMAQYGYRFVGEVVGALGTARIDYGDRAAAPATPAPATGDAYFDTTLGLNRWRSGAVWRGSLNTTGSLGPAAPAFGTLVPVPAGVAARHVFGTIRIASTVANAASIQVDLGPVAGPYTAVQRVAMPIVLVGVIDFPYSFIARAGQEYRFVAGGLAGVTETIQAYSFVDLD